MLRDYFFNGSFDSSKGVHVLSTTGVDTDDAAVAVDVADTADTNDNTDTGAVDADTDAADAADAAGTTVDTDLDVTGTAGIAVDTNAAGTADVTDAVDAFVSLSPIFGFISHLKLSEKIRVNLCVGGGLFSSGFHFLPTTYFVLCVG